MTTFAENNIVFPDGQLNVAPLPEALMRNGFTPETRDAPGMPLPAQYLNWLFRDVYRNQQANQDATNNALKKDANLSDIVDRDEALKNLELKEAAKRDVGNGENQIPDMSFFQSGTSWFKLPNGITFQWGMTGALGPNQTQEVIFPIPFSNAVFGVQVSVNGTLAGTAEYFNLTKSGVTIANGLDKSATNPIFWLAIGR
ncbi:hypothetical protein I2492_03235 [Budviciaceae bacterium CWB-B4]|uniref:Putative tail fiber protein gp53-like C-terminal domain-containing protein n=1 Tax=Limnobaculum xujianqingii TaxID=2738837 RepID=A0A9D7FWC2_9GAMM|nr:hypothetical protein [Limnobaculum xujianqingii]MBK5072032.1 hypothetical protein [Limnobaculum xujianqingii]MBK5175341.1 hypothetical protein [Limnobaculum xujianqingii]